jgi:hypothetical protein
MRKSLSIFALVLLMTGALGLGTVAAHPLTKHKNIPLTCFFPAVASNSKTVDLGNSFVGTLYVYIGRDTCNHTVYDGQGVYDGTNGTAGCLSATVALNVTDNTIPVESGSTSSGSVGPTSRGCSKQSISFVTNSFEANHGFLEACNHLTLQGTNNYTICATYQS